MSENRTKTIVDLAAIAGAVMGENRGQHTKFDDKRKQEFLDILRTNANCAVSARSVGINPTTVIAHRNKYPEFDEACNEAIDEASQYVDSELMRRGIIGVDKPVWYQGKIVGYEKQYSDTIALRVAESLNPKKWSPKSQVDLKADVKVSSSDVKSKLLGMLKFEEDEIIDGEFTED